MKRSLVLITSFLILFLITPVLAERKLSADYREIHCKHFFYGYPLGTPRTNDLIIRDIYALSSNDETKFADWVAYRLDRKTVGGNARTKRKWKADPWLEERETLEPEDYEGAYKKLKTDRGHQAPLGSFKGTGSWEETNYLSNITPQNAYLNRTYWRILEERVRKLVDQYKMVYVITGPIYGKKMEALPGADEPHRVPSGYWKMIFVQDEDDPGTIKSAAFLFPQEVSRGMEIPDFAVTIDEIERKSGLDFLYLLPETLEIRLESVIQKEWIEENFR
jgi:endonuclease G